MFSSNTANQVILKYACYMHIPEVIKLVCKLLEQHIDMQLVDICIFEQNIFVFNR